MKQLIVLKQDRDYYGGLALLLLSCLSLVWALWRDAFNPAVFLAGFLLFSWGYLLLWRHDFRGELKELRGELEMLRASVSPSAPNAEAWSQERPESPPAPREERPEEPGQPDNRPLELRL